MTKEGISNGYGVIPRGTVVEEEADTQIFNSGERFRRCIGDEFESHRRRIVRNAVEIRIRACEVRKAEERLKATVGAELDIQWDFPAGSDGVIEGLDDLSGEGCTCDGADGVGGVVGEVEFVGVGQSTDLEQGWGSEKGGGWDGGIVDCCYVDVVEY